MSSHVIIIPAYEPSQGLVTLARELRDMADCAIVVVDDGSGPAFSSVFEEVSRTPGVIVVRNAVNLGKGAALKNGFNHALLAFPEITSFVTADADGQHLPGDILAVAQASSPDALVLGARAFNLSVPLRSKIGNTVSRYAYRLLTGLICQDTQTGLRSIPRRLAEICASISRTVMNSRPSSSSRRRTPDSSFREVPIRTIYIDENSASHFNPVMDPFRIYFVLLRYAVSSIATALTDFLVSLHPDGQRHVGVQRQHVGTGGCAVDCNSCC